MITKKLILLMILCATLFACNNSEKDENVENDTIEAVESSEEKDVQQERGEIEGNRLDKAIKDNQPALEQLKKVRKIIAGQDQLKNLVDVEKALAERDSLISLLNNDEKFAIWMDENDMLFKELEEVGIYVITGEGLFFGLDKSPLFDDIIDKVADEPYKLKNKIENLNSASQGSEYPYFDISEEMEIIPLAEKMLTKYPGHKYNKKIAEIMEHALRPLTDFHKVVGSHTSYIVGGYDVSEYPGATDISFHTKFAEESSSKKYAGLVNKILNSVSTLESYEFDKFYFVEVPPLDSDSIFADEKLNEALKNLPKELKDRDDTFKYLWLGVDVPHQIYLREGEETKTALIYRFFDKKEAAEKSLKVIQQIIPAAKLVEYELTEADNKYRN